MLTNHANAYPTASEAPLASGAYASLYNASTGLNGAHTVPANYTLSVLTYWWSFYRPVMMRTLIDNYLVQEWFHYTMDSHYEHDLLEDYNPLDPTGQTSHTFEWQVTNLAAEALRGYYVIITKLIEAGTVRPENKTVKCSYCGHLHEVLRSATRVTCPKCGMTQIYDPILFGDELNLKRSRR